MRKDSAGLAGVDGHCRNKLTRISVEEMAFVH